MGIDGRREEFEFDQKYLREKQFEQPSFERVQNVYNPSHCLHTNVH